MNARTDCKASTRRACRVTIILGFALLWVTGLSADVCADSSVDDRWQFSVPLYLTVSAFYQKKGEATVAHESVAATVEVQLASQARPYSAGLFFDYQISPDPRYDGTVIVGGLFKYRFYNWDTTTYLVYDKAPRAPSEWLYAGRIRYRLSETHKLGIEAFGSFEDSASPRLMIGYYGTISRTVSVKFVAGLNTNAGQERVARTELVWQVN